MKSVVIAMTLLMVGCGMSSHQVVVADVDTKNWSMPAEVIIDNVDTLTPRNISIVVCYNKEFEALTLPLQITTVSPDSRRYSEPFTLDMSHQASPASISHEKNIIYRRNAVFSHIGAYRIIIAPRNDIKGVEAIGVNIVKSE